MAKTPQKDILTRVTKLVPDAIHRLQDIPGGQKMVELANESKTRIDEMQKKLRGLDALERRVARLERQLAAQTAKKPAAAKSGGTSGGTSTGKSGAAAAAKKTASTSSARKPAAKKS